MLKLEEIMALTAPIQARDARNIIDQAASSGKSECNELGKKTNNYYVRHDLWPTVLSGPFATGRI